MRKLLAFAACGVLALGAAACGDDEDSGGERGWRRRRKRLRFHPYRRLQHRRPIRPGGGRRVPGSEPRCAHHGRHVRNRRRLREVLRRRDRHLGRLSSHRRGGRGADLQEEQRHLHRGPGGQRRHLGRHQSQPQGRLHDHRSAQGAVGAGLEGQRPERDRSEAARHRAQPVRPGDGLRTFEFFTEEINGEEGNTRKDYQPSEDDNVLVQGVEGEDGGSATSASPTTSRTRTSWDSYRSTQATAASSRARRRSRTAPTSRSRGRCSCTRAARRSRSPKSRRSWTTWSRTTSPSPRPRP